MAESNMSGIPGVGAMTDTLEFVKNLWGGMKIPGMAMPSLSVDEVNKQITDLKAVESWLNKLQGRNFELWRNAEVSLPSFILHPRECSSPATYSSLR